MVKQRLKYAHTSRYKHIIFSFLKDLASGNISQYDIVSMQGLPKRWRVRLGNIRIVLKKDQQGNFLVVKIQERGDIYKK